MLLPILPALLAACLSASPPEVTAVTPGVAMPGDSLLISGQGFDEEVVGLLVMGAETVPLPMDVTSSTEALAVLPDDLLSGSWTLHVETPRGRHGSAIAVEVWRAETEPPCDKRYALSTETSRTQRKVAIERIFIDRPSTRDVFFGDDLAAVTLTRTPTRAGGECSAVWLVDAQGQRWLLADDEDRDLQPVVRELATVLGVELRP